MDSNCKPLFCETTEPILEPQLPEGTPSEPSRAELLRSNAALRLLLSLRSLQYAEIRSSKTCVICKDKNTDELFKERDRLLADLRLAEANVQSERAKHRQRRDRLMYADMARLGLFVAGMLLVVWIMSA